MLTYTWSYSWTTPKFTHANQKKVHGGEVNLPALIKVKSELNSVENSIYIT